MYSVHVSIEEKVLLTVIQDGDIEKMEIKGALSLSISDIKFVDKTCLVMKKPDNPKLVFKVCWLT